MASFYSFLESAHTNEFHMRTYIPPAIIDQILAQAEILEIAREYLPGLKKRGANYWALSPFKEEKTASFSVHPGKQIFNCFASGKKGNITSFLIEIDPKINTWLEAMHWLANKYGIETQGELSEREREAWKQKQRLLTLCKFAENWYHKQLTQSSDAKSLMNQLRSSRELREADIKSFQLGYAPDDWQAFTNAAKAKGYTEAELLSTGLAKKNKHGKLYDFFRDRLMFPISDVWGNVIAFGGRAVGESEIKYLNIGETILYKKKEVLYGLDKAAKAIQAADLCFLVEGYLDVVIPAGQGIDNVVATCGTSLTQAQIKLIKRFTQKVCLMYDSDEAGIKAASRGVELLISEEMEVEVLILPEKHDPDSFVRDVGKDAFLEYVEIHKQSGFAFLFHQLKKELDPKTPTGKTQLIEKLLDSVRKIAHPILKETYIEEIASLTKVEADTLGKMLHESPIVLKKAMTWQSYTSIIQRLGLGPSKDFQKAEDGGVEILYHDLKDRPLTKVENGQKKAITRITTQFGMPYGIYLPEVFRKTDPEELLQACDGILVLVQDELTVDILSQLGIAAVGLARPDGFRSGASRKKTNKVLQQLMGKGVRKILYLLSGEAFALPPVRRESGKAPFADTDVRANADFYVESLTLLTQCLPKTRIWALHPDHRNENFLTRNPRWLEDLLLKHPKADLEEMLKACIGEGSGKGFLCAEEISDHTRAQHEELLRVNDAQRFFDFHGIEALGDSFKMGRKTYTVNLQNNKVSLKDEGRPEPDVKLIDGIYYARQRGDGWKDITNFSMECKLRIMGKGAFGIYTLKNRNTNQQRKVIIDNLTFRDASKFAERVSEIPRLGAFSKATCGNLGELQQLICEGSPEAVNLKRIMGYHIMANELDESESPNTEAFWVFGNGLLNGKFQAADSQGIVEVANQRYFLPANSIIREDPERHDKRFERQQAFEYKESDLSYEHWIQRVMKVYGDNGHKGFCFTTMACYYDLILEKMGKVPLLHLVGPPGTGKNELIDSMSRLWGHIKWMDLQTSKITPAGYAAFFEQYKNALNIVNEYNPSSVDDARLDPIKATYEGKLGEKKAGPNTSEMYSGKVSSAVVIMGQEAIYQKKAINHRCVVCEFKERRYTAAETTEFNQLKELEKRGLGQIFSKLAIHRDLVDERFEDRFQRIQLSLKEEMDFSTTNTERLVRNWATMMTVLFLLIEEGKIEYPMSQKQMIAFAAREIEHHDNQMVKHGLLDIFFQDFIQAYYLSKQFDLNHQHIFHDPERKEYAFRDKKLKKNLSFDTPEGIITIQTNNIFSRFEAYLSWKKLKIENSSKGDLRRELRQHSAFLGASDNEWIGYQMDEHGHIITKYSDKEGRALPLKFRSSAYVFDAAKLGIDIKRQFTFDEVEVTE